MNIALIGYGKMGKTIHCLAKEQGYTVTSIIDPESSYFKTITEESMKNVDVCIEFSTPEACVENIKRVLSFKKPMVIGTTGWYKYLHEVIEEVEKQQCGLIYASNFSLGVNLLYHIVEYSSQLLCKVNAYDPYIIEAHHQHKKDAPSGTAKELMSLLAKNYKRKEDTFSVGVTRAGSIPGMHEIGFDSEFDTIRINHTARNRNGFARGALLAAKFIKDKKGVYNFKEEFKKIIKEKF